MDSIARSDTRAQRAAHAAAPRLGRAATRRRLSPRSLATCGPVTRYQHHPFFLLLLHPNMQQNNNDDIPPQHPPETLCNCTCVLG
eukprot:3443622-Pleurochrysis_carterae.AAC.1